MQNEGQVIERMSLGASAGLRWRLIVAVAEGGVMGLRGQIPWRIPADLRRFKTLTSGFPMLMGRKTFQSLGRVLPGREHWVLSQDQGYLQTLEQQPHPQVRGFADLDAVLSHCKRHQLLDCFVIGGAQIYQLALPWVDEVYWTQVHLQVEGDVSLPGDFLRDFEVVSREDHPEDQVSYLLLYRRKAVAR